MEKIRLALELLSIIFEFTGTWLIAFTALRVHHRFLMEHKVDNRVFKMMKREQQIGFIGIIFLSIGFLFSLVRIFLFLI